MIKIDGSCGEGGGQVLRTALTLAALTGQQTRIHHIRANRKVPGLRPQHLTGVLALAEICQAQVQGAMIDSQEVTFWPQSTPRPGDYPFDVAQAASGGSAGSVSLLFQTLLLPLAMASSHSRLTLKGGTHVAWSPPFDYLASVYLPTLERMGLRASCTLQNWGFYPRGGGQIVAEIQGLTDRPPEHALTPLELDDRGELQRITGLAVACNLPSHIPQRMANRARNLLKAESIPVQITPQRVRGASPGAFLFLTAEYANTLAGFSALGAKGKPSEAVAEEAYRDFMTFHQTQATVDPHLADQLLLPMALAGGRSSYTTSTITAHLLTNAHVIREFLPVQIEITGEAGQPGRVVVHGFPPEAKTS